MQFRELAYRDCPWCMVRLAAMYQPWSSAISSASGSVRIWAAMVCPRCAGVVLVEVALDGGTITAGNAIPPDTAVGLIRQVPETNQQRFAIGHLPQDVAGFFHDALVVLDAGVPDAAAVQLRRTLEAAAAHRGVQETRLVDSIKKLIEQGAVTRDFADLLHYVRKLGNVGAHYTDEKLGQEDVERSVRFTAQLLRNLFEVPGELAELIAAAPAPTASDDLVKS